MQQGHHLHQGIFYSSVRVLSMGFFGIIGLMLGFMIFFVLMGLITSTAKEEVDNDYKVEVIANADGVRKIMSKQTPVVLQLNVTGFIGSELLNMQSIGDQLIESREGTLKKDRVKALFVHLNTPGGTVIDADGIYRAIKQYKEQHNVPVYGYVDGMCASGGMYIASACDKIYASDVSLIGSVGVLSPSFFNVTQLMNTLGVEALVLSEGKGKDDLNPFRKWSEGEADAFKSLLTNYYNMFVDIVVKGRPSVSREKLIKDYGARLFPAKEAETIGFIDGTGFSRDDALRKLLNEISIEDDYYQVVQMKAESWASKLFNGSAPFLSGKVEHTLNLPHDLDPSLQSQFLYLWRPGKE